MQQLNSVSCIELHLPIIFLPLGRMFRMIAQTWAIHSMELTNTLIPASDKALFRVLAIVMSFKSHHKDCLNVFLRIISSNEICTAFTCTFVSLFLSWHVGLRTGNHNCGLEFLCIVLLSKLAMEENYHVLSIMLNKYYTHKNKPTMQDYLLYD